MNWVLVGVAAVFAVIGLIVWWFWRKNGQELALMSATPTSTAADAAKLAAGTVVELKGPLRCDALLSGEFSKQSCIYYKATIEREYESRRRDSKGNTDRTRHKETIQSNERFAPCVLEDASGKIAINFAGAKVEGVETVKRFEPAASAAGLGGVVSSVLGVGDRDIGMHYTEVVIPAGIPVYVLATALGNGSVGHSPSQKTPFVISHKSEEERTKDLGSTRTWQMVGMVVCAIVTVIALFFAVKTGSGETTQKKSGVEAPAVSCV